MQYIRQTELFTVFNGEISIFCMLTFAAQTGASHLIWMKYYIIIALACQQILHYTFSHAVILISYNSLYKFLNKASW